MMEETWEQVIACNNAGTHHFLAENFPEAISLFEKSLIQAKAILRRERSMYPSALPQESRIQLVLRDLRHCPMPESKRSQGATPNSDEDLVARCCIWIAEPPEGPLSIQDCSTFTLSTVYNIGITYHMMGIRHGSVPFLAKANKYYGLSWNLQSQIQLRYEVYLSIYFLNNWATLYRSLGNENVSRKLLQQLYCQINHLGQLGVREHVHDLNVFMKNLLDLFFHHTHAAGAA